MIRLLNNTMCPVGGQALQAYELSWKSSADSSSFVKHLRVTLLKKTLPSAVKVLISKSTHSSQRPWAAIPVKQNQANI